MFVSKRKEWKGINYSWIYDIMNFKIILSEGSKIIE